MDGRGTALRRAAVVACVTAFTLGGAMAAPAQEVHHDGRKSPPLAFALSFVVPGAGQLYNGQYLKAGAAFGGAVLTAGAILLTASDILQLDDDTSGTGVHVLGAVGAGIIIWSWIDAPLSARAINRRLEAGGAGLEMGPRIQVAPTGRSMDFSLLRIEF